MPPRAAAKRCEEGQRKGKEMKAKMRKEGRKESSSKSRKRRMACEEKQERGGGGLRGRGGGNWCGRGEIGWSLSQSRIRRQAAERSEGGRRGRSTEW